VGGLEIVPVARFAQKNSCEMMTLSPCVYFVVTLRFFPPSEHLVGGLGLFEA